MQGFPAPFSASEVNCPTVPAASTVWISQTYADAVPATSAISSSAATATMRTPRSIPCAMQEN